MKFLHLFLKLFGLLVPVFGLFMAEATPAGGDGGDPPATPPPGEGEPPAGDEQNTTITFKSQAELDKLFGIRMADASKKAVAGLLEKLGVETEDALAATIKAAKAAKDAQMTELEQAQAQIATAQEQASQAEARAVEVQAQAQETLMKAAVMTAASNFQDPGDAWLYVERDKITTNADSGEFEGVAEAVKAVSEAKAYLLKPENGNAGPGTPPRKQQSGIQRAWQQQNQQPPVNSAEYVPTVKL